MTIKSIEDDVANAIVGAGILYDISKNSGVYLNLNGKFFKNQNGYYGNIGFNYKFTTQPANFYQRAS